MLARLAGTAIVMACALALPLLSADVWAYAAYGELLRHGADPWAHAYRAVDVAPYADPLLGAALRAWDGSLPRDVYGPLFTLPCALVAGATARWGPTATVATLRALACVALLACVVLAARRRPALATLLAVHPVVLWAAAEGHNDVFWLALVLAADRVRAGPRRIAALACAAAVKAVAVVPLAAALAALPRGRRALPAALAVVALAVAYAPLVAPVLAHGFPPAAGPPRLSLLHAPALAAWTAPRADAGSPRLWGAAILALAGLLAAGGLVAVARAMRRGDGGAGAALLGWLLWPAPEPWYAVWLIVLVATTGGGPANRALLAASFSGALLYLQDLVPGTALADPALLGGIMLAVYALPILLALAPSPAPQANPAPPTPPPLAAPSAVPAPAASTTPRPAPSPSATASPGLSATPNPFGYIVAVPEPTPAASGTPAAPRIVEVALNDRVLHKGGIVLVRITTSNDVTAVVARTMGREIAVPPSAPGIFTGQEQLPAGIPFFLLNRSYDIEFVATTADGRHASVTLPIRLER